MQRPILLFLFSFLLILSRDASAQNFTSIDVNPGAASSTAYQFTPFNGKVYFVANGDASQGFELWVTDGTQGGTSIVKDILPGPGSSYPNFLTVIGSKLFFIANDSIHGKELWVSDGTAAGTNMVSDILPGTVSSAPDFFTAFNGKLYFSATDGVHGSELYVSDGTPGGTSMVKDINAGIGDASPEGYAIGPGSSYIDRFNEWNGKLYFRADDGTHGLELWSTDGTTAGTTMVADIYPGSMGSNPYFMTPFNGKLIFAAEGDTINGFELWETDGTSAGTSLIKNIDPGSAGHNGNADVADYSGFVELNGKLYFSANQAATGYELWSTDGTTAGTTLVKDIIPGTGSSYAGSYYAMTAFNGKLYFSSGDATNGQQLWSSDGTSAGTNLFKVLSSYTPYNASPGFFQAYNNNQLIFIASVDTLNQYQLWGSDGTPAGTHILAPAIAPNTNPLGHIVTNGAYAVANNSLYLNADFNSIGDELWIYTTPTGIVSVDGSNAITARPNPFTTSVTLSGLQNGTTYTVQVLDITGREFYNSTVENASADLKINMPDLATGIYLMHISGNGTTQTFKMVKN